MKQKKNMEVPTFDPPVDEMVTIMCSDGPAQFKKAEYDYFIATWNYTGNPEEEMSQHSAAELHALYNNTH